jgi:hypothetical protein
VETFQFPDGKVPLQSLWASNYFPHGNYSMTP